MDKELMIQILKEIEGNLLNGVKDNEAVIRIPIKVGFDENGKLSSISGFDTKQLYEKYNK